MSIQYRDRQQSWKGQASSNTRMSVLKFCVAIVLIIVVIMNVSYVLPAQPPSIQVTGPEPETDSTLIFKAEADASVAEAEPAVSTGTSPDLEVIQTNGESVETYLRFTVSGLSGEIQNVRLRVYSTTEMAEDGPALYVTDNTWTETEITWENRPVYATSKSGDQTLVRRYSWVEYDVTPLITDNGTYSFVLAGDSAEDLLFSSRESSNGPELIITVAPSTQTES